MLVDGGASLKVLSRKAFQRMQIPTTQLRPTGTFQGVNHGSTQPLSQVTLLDTFGGPNNFRTESITFDVADTPFPYNGILGHPALAKFMVATHYTYNTLKMLGPWDVITIKSDRRDAIYCVEFYRMAAAVVLESEDVPPGPGDGVLD